MADNSNNLPFLSWSAAAANSGPNTSAGTPSPATDPSAIASATSSTMSAAPNPSVPSAPIFWPIAPTTNYTPALSSAPGLNTGRVVLTPPSYGLPNLPMTSLFGPTVPTATSSAGMGPSVQATSSTSSARDRALAALRLQFNSRKGRYLEQDMEEEDLNFGPAQFVPLAGPSDTKCIHAPPADGKPDILSQLPNDIGVHLASFLPDESLAILSATSRDLKKFWGHLYRCRDGNKGVWSRVLSAARRKLDARLLDVAISYNKLPAKELLESVDLFKGARAGAFDWVERVLREGVDVNKKIDLGDGSQNTALIAVLTYAERKKGTRCPLMTVRQLVQHGAFPDVHGKVKILHKGVMSEQTPAQLLLKLGRHDCLVHEERSENACLFEMLELFVEHANGALAYESKDLEDEIIYLREEDRLAVRRILKKAKTQPYNSSELVATRRFKGMALEDEMQYMEDEATGFVPEFDPDEFEEYHPDDVGADEKE